MNLRIVTLVLALLCALSLVACGGQKEPVETLPIITRPPETTEPPVEEIPKHEHVFTSLPVFTPYERPDRDDDSIGYTAYPCTVEGCTEIKDDMIRPVLIALDFEGETTLHEYLEAEDRVSPLVKNEISYSAGTLTGGAFYAEGKKNEQVFIVSELALDELPVFTVSFDCYFGISSNPGKDTFFGFGKTSAERDSVYYFQLRERDGKLYYLENFKENELRSIDLLSYTFEREKWYHFDVEINMEKDEVALWVGEWDETRTELLSTSYLGTCQKMHATEIALDTVVFRISASNGLGAMDNFFITLPEK